MNVLIALYMVFANNVSHAEAHALQATAPTYLSPESAYWHLQAARVAAVQYKVRPELLLAIARHESNFNITTQTPEPGNRVSCGVMTPVPKHRCTSSDLGLYSGYALGAAHLRTWLDHCHDKEICALLSYAGGSGLYRVCAKLGRWPTARGTNACDVAYQFRREANRIQEALWAARRNFELHRNRPNP